MFDYKRRTRINQGILQGDNFQINVIDELTNEDMLKSTSIVSIVFLKVSVYVPMFIL